jgi:hypothetical protein
MTRAINEEDFANPISRRLAMGESLGEKDQLWLDPLGREKLARATGGILNPARYEIAKGTRIYRFASVTDGPERTMSGGWWVARPELDHMINFASREGKTLGYVVRLLCCVPPEWGSALNFIVAVRTTGLVAAWRGLANTAAAEFKLEPGMPRAAAGTTLIFAQNRSSDTRVNQLYIPGTRREGATRAMFSYEGQWQTEGAPDWIYGSGR